MTRGRIALIAGGGLIVAVVWYLVLLAPKGAQIDKARTQLVDAKAQEQTLRATLTRLQDLARQGPARQAELLRLAGAIPSEPDLAGFITAANDIAVNSDVDWISISPAPPAASQGGLPSTIALSMQIQGGFFQVLDYLNRLEALPRIVVVDSVSIAPGTGVSPVLTVNLAARMFTTAAPLGTGAGATTTTAPGGASPTTATTAPGGATPTTARAGG